MQTAKDEYLSAGRIFGYSRVSSKEQNLSRQIDALREYVEDDYIVIDKESGATMNRPGYNALKGALGLRRGDTLIICSLDRLSRNKEHIHQELRWFKENGIRLKILDLPTSLIDVPPGQEWVIEMVNNILMEVLGSIAEQERLTIKKRQREGIEAAKKRGKHMGRPKLEMPDNFAEVYQMWKTGTITAKEAMWRLQMPSTSFYRMVKVYEELTQKVT